MSFNVPPVEKRSDLLKVEILMSFNVPSVATVSESTESRNFNEF